MYNERILRNHRKIRWIPHFNSLVSNKWIKIWPIYRDYDAAKYKGHYYGFRIIIEKQ